MPSQELEKTLWLPLQPPSTLFTSTHALHAFKLSYHNVIVSLLQRNLDRAHGAKELKGKYFQSLNQTPASTTKQISWCITLISKKTTLNVQMPRFFCRMQILKQNRVMLGWYKKTTSSFIYLQTQQFLQFILRFIFKKQLQKTGSLGLLISKL